MNGYGNSVFLRTAWEVSSGGSAPANTVAPVISGTQVVGSTLTSTTGTWTGIPAPTFTYQWFRGATLIGGATSSTYVLVQADAGNTSNITCKVTGTNAFGNATATSNTLAQIFDFDANAFITSATITNTTQKAATNSLTIDLKGYSIWTKMKALYPMVGGTATTMKWNLKDPRDLDAAYRLLFIGGGTWDANGYTPNGSNGYANTNFNPTTGFTVNDNVHLSYYSRTNVNTTQVEIGSAVAVSGSYLMLEIRTAGTTYFIMNRTTAFATISDADSRAFYMGNRIGTSEKGFKNNSNVVSLTNNSLTRPNFNVYLGALNAANIATFYSTKQCAFSSIGDGLTDTDAANFYTAVQAFNTTLGRQV